MPHALRILCPNDQCGAMIALYDRGVFEPLRARIIFGRGGVQTLNCAVCGARRQWHTIPVGRMVTYQR